MEILALTVAGSLLLAVFFIVGFLAERADGSAPNPDRDCLLPLDDERATQSQPENDAH